jgi:hypothetical protein
VGNTPHYFSSRQQERDFEKQRRTAGEQGVRQIVQHPPGKGVDFYQRAVKINDNHGVL